MSDLEKPAGPKRYNLKCRSLELTRVSRLANPRPTRGLAFLFVTPLFVLSPMGCAGWGRNHCPAYLQSDRYCELLQAILKMACPATTTNATAAAKRVRNTSVPPCRIKGFVGGGGPRSPWIGQLSPAPCWTRSDNRELQRTDARWQERRHRHGMQGPRYRLRG